VIKVIGKCWERHLEGTAKGAQFDDINPSLASFDFADERLGFSEPLSKSSLRQIGFDPGLA
jgi:hypothetical protein